MSVDAHWANERGYLLRSKKYKQGDRVTISGSTTHGPDTREFGHEFKEGDEVILSHFDPRDDSWWAHIESVDPVGDALDDDGYQSHEQNWVGEEDLTPEIQVTQEEVEAAMKSLGLK